MNSFYTQNELVTLGFASIGTNVHISKKASFYGCSSMHLGSNVRIDDFCLLSGEIIVGDFVHISAYSALYGKAGIHLGNFCGISPRSILFSATDDFSGEYLISPLVPEELTNVTTGRITMEDFSHVGANSIIMPAVTLARGAVVGAFSFVKENLPAWTINAGNPCRFIRDRKQKNTELAIEVRNQPR